LGTSKAKYILVAPLDWGLGHTTRCVPLIRHIQRMGHIPVVACNSWQRSFITETFGQIEVVELEGYNVSYSEWNKWAQAGVLLQMPRIIKTIKAEHNWLLKLCTERQIDGIISDNRYGLSHPRIPSVVLTHQPGLLIGLGALADKVVRKVHYSYLERYGATWIVDVPGSPSLGGKMSHPVVLPNRTKYVGLLSRFEKTTEADNAAEGLLILLSGPEPQRTNISKLLWQQVCNYKGKVTFVEGNNNVQPPTLIPENITYHKRLTDQQLGPILKKAAVVICRSGYSTLMDLVALQQKAIVIPTPGQTEQEYLGTYMRQAGICYSTKQSGFNLEKTLHKIESFPFHTLGLPGASYTMYEHVVSDWLNKI